MGFTITPETENYRARIARCGFQNYRTAITLIPGQFGHG
jgi:hypothetical protein